MRRGRTRTNEDLSVGIQASGPPALLRAAVGIFVLGLVPLLLTVAMHPSP